MTTKKTTPTPTTQHTKGTTMKNAVTVQYDFFNPIGTDQPLFSVRAGIPLEDAFNHFNVLLSDTKSVMEDIVTATILGEKPQTNFAALHLLQILEGLGDSIESGYLAFEKQVNHDARINENQEV